MMIISRSISASFLIISILFVDAFGQFGGLVNLGRNVVNTAVNVATAPTKVVVNTGRAVTGNASPSEIYRPYQDIGRSAGSSVQQAAKLAADPQNFLYEKAAEFASKAGPAGQFIFDVGTFTNKLQQDFGGSVLQYTGSILQGQDPFQITAAALAAGIKAARDRHLANSKPIPDDVKKALEKYFQASTLARARYTVGTVQITLPNFINRGNKMFGNENAVTADDVIIFSTDPGSFSQNPTWWAHEMTHVRQYEVWGVEGFAYRYMYHFRRIEDDAVENAKAITGQMSPGSQAPRTADYPVSFNMATNLPSETGLASPNYSANQERYVARCIFPTDPYPVMYMITNYSRIIAVSPYTGEWMQVGWAAPARFPATVWTYQTPAFAYDVRANGVIIAPGPVYDMFGRIVGTQEIRVGYVVRFEEPSFRFK